MWKGRFAKATADLVQQYGESISYDWRLYKHDIAGSIAHARAQVSAKLLSSDEFAAIENGLREIEKEIEAGEFDFSIELEDIHMNISQHSLSASVLPVQNSTLLVHVTTRSPLIRASTAGRKLIASLSSLRGCSNPY